ncbi:MAG: phosphatidylethanolamine-binding protein [Noviherbaspirillum sp.]|nr:phosphatidylethanolamine-binding protein [Noviherbaspirillum sp.]
MSLSLTSGAFRHGADIPRKYTCDGQNISPPLSWSEVPSAALSLALIVEDPDAPDPAAPQRTWTHWVLYDIPPDATGLNEGIRTQGLPRGTHEGFNDWRRTGYGGPCPPIGRHRYFFRLYALDKVLGDLGKPDRLKLLGMMKGHVIDETELLGLYQHPA